MRGARLGALAATCGALCVAAGCVLVTGSTSGYVLEDAGVTSTPVVEAGACIADSGVCVNVGCTSSVNCDGGEICCLGALGAQTGLTCETSCGIFPQACQSNAECGDAGGCTLQECPFEGQVLTFSLCGVALGCTAVAGGSSDGGADSGG
jgi:hypothetical protein